MKRLGAPPAVALLALLLAAAASPDLGLLALHRMAGGLVAGIAALFVIALADRRAPGRLVALGAATVTLALGYDVVRGERGTLALERGQGTQTFVETGPGGRELGLRPLGTQVTLEDVEADGTAVLAEAEGGRRIRVLAHRAAALASYRLGHPRALAPAVVIHASGGGDAEVTLREGESAPAGDLDVTVERYFPDFALDQGQQPFTRSSEARNPAALLRVRRGPSAWRVFVIRALPGIHRPEGLDRTLTLVGVTGGNGVEMSVSREPAALLAALGVLVAMGGVAWSRW